MLNKNTRSGFTVIKPSPKMKNVDFLPEIMARDCRNVHFDEDNVVFGLEIDDR